MGNLRNSAKLTKGKAIGAQVNLADTFNEIVDVLNRLEVDTPLKLDKLPFGKWIIGLESSQGSGTGDMLLDDVSIHKRVVTGDPLPPSPVQLLNFDSPSGTTMPAPEEPADGDTPLDSMDDFQLIVRRVNPSTSEASLAYIDKAGLKKILGAKEELIPIMEETDDGGFTLTAKKALLFHTEDLEEPKTHSFAKSILVTSLDLEGRTLTATFEQALVGEKAPYSVNPVLTLDESGSITYIGGGGSHYDDSDDGTGGGNHGWTGGGGDGTDGDNTGGVIGTPGAPGDSCGDDFPGGGGGGDDDDFPGDTEDNGDFPGKEFKCW